MEQLIIILLLIIAAEATYLVAANSHKISRVRGRSIFVDTSVLIDGRIMAVAQAGFIGDTLFIPRSVVGELQFLADNADPEKRSRARHGLDIVSELQQLPGVDVRIFRDGSKAAEGVDERLLKLAKSHHGVIMTIDYNLNKVAQVEHITVLNVNDLAMNLRMAYLPGEKIMLELTQKGQDGHQAVGHLQDGTMVVVEHASSVIGKTVEVEFIRSLQTAAGKMMFARLVERPKNAVQPRPNKQVKPVAAKSAPQVYHSDTNDQRTAQRGNRQQPAKPRSNQQAGQQGTSKRPQSRPQNRRTTPEDSLIKLANSQD